MSDDARPDARAGLTIDLSSPRTGKRPRKPTTTAVKGPPPLVVQTINLSTPKPPKAETPASASHAAKPAAGRSKGLGGPTARKAPRSAPREAPHDARGGGTSLADLLDEATLARLRGG